MKGKKYLWAGIAMAFTMILSVMFATPVFADVSPEEEKDVDNTDVIVTASVGMDGKAVENRAVPIAITVQEIGADFEGTLRVIIPASWDCNALAYEKSITVPRGGEKTFSFTLPPITDAGFVRIELENTRGKVIYSQRETINTIAVSDHAVVGILSSDYTALNYFDGAIIDAGNYIRDASVIQLTEDTVPENSQGLECCSFIIIDNYNTSQLSNKQINALTSWVANGGILIFGTGSKASYVLEGFQETVTPVQSTGLNKGTISLFTTSTETLFNVDVANLNAYGWEDVQNSIAVGAPAYRYTYGSGSVLLLSYDLAMEPITSWTAGKPSLASAVLSNAAPDQVLDNALSYSGFSYNDGHMKEAVNRVDGNKTPNGFVYALIFLVYVICIGPVSYLVLKSKEQREKMWVVMPIIAVFFTGVVFLSSMMYKIYKPFVDAVHIVEFNNGSKITTSYMKAQSPKSRAYNVDLTDGYETVQAWADDVNYDLVGTTEYRFAVNNNNKNAQLAVKKGMAFTEQYFLGNKEEFSAGSGFDLNLECHVSSFTGTVTNNTGYDLTDVVIVYSGKEYFIGKMKKGETIDLSTKYMKTASTSYYYVSDWMEEDPEDNILFAKKHKKLMITQSVYKVMRERANLDMNQGVVIGMIDNYDSSAVDGYKVKEYQAAVAVSNFYQVAEEYQSFTLLVDDINHYMVGSDNYPYVGKKEYPEGYDYFDTYELKDMQLYGDEDRMVLYDLSDVAWQSAYLLHQNKYMKTFETQIPDEYDEYDDYDYTYDELEPYYGEDATILFYNNSTGLWDEMFVDDYVLEDLSDYVDEEGLLKVTYKNPDTDEYTYTLPKLSLIGGDY